MSNIDSIDVTNTESNINITKVDIETYQKLIKRDQKQKEAQKKYRNGAHREKQLEYLREYAKTHRDNDKEKEYYEKNKEKKKQMASRNSKKYLAFYRMYKDKHPEFLLEWEKQDQAEEKSEEKNV